MTSKRLVHELDEATRDKRLLEHPFYRAWAAGTLKVEDLSFYAGQYWRQVEAFPGYLDSVAERLEPGAARDVVEENLSDERDGDHPGLWIRFAETVGCEETAVRGSKTEPETAACVESFGEAARSRSLPFVLGMLYGYESQTPEVAKTKVQGLREHYGIDGEGIEYFELHGELDVEHSRDLAGAIESIATTEGARAEAVAGARAGAEAIYGLLDGVARVRNITCPN